MKTKIIFLCSLFATSLLNAQTANEVKLEDIKVPVSPAFSILDFSPKIIENPGTIKAFTFNLASIAGKSGGIPKNFAFEFAPFWFFKHPQMNIYKYFGLRNIGNDSFSFKPNIFHGIRSTSVSLGSIFKDSSKALPVDVNYVGYALRSNLINVRHRKVLTMLKQGIENQNAALQKKQIKAIEKCDTLLGPERLDCIGNFITKYEDSLSHFLTPYLAARPIFNVDIALAASTAFGSNNFRNRESYRTGGWITLAYYQPLLSAKKINEDINNLLQCKNYLNVFFLFRALKENRTRDFKTFEKKNLIDFGGRAELEFNRFSASLEYVKRAYKDDKSLNSKRTVAILQYRINDELFLVGTFGKDFGEIENLITLFGLNWGFGERTLYKPFIK